MHLQLLKPGFMSAQLLSLAIILIVGLAVQKAHSKSKETEKLAAVDRVDVERYMGKWYEIATIPMWFQRKCASGTTANYTLNPDGTIEVINQCVTNKGKVIKAKGRAWSADKKTNAKLKVSFVPCGLKLFTGDYWIIDLDPDYQYAVVGHPSRNYGWILSRKPEMDPETLKAVAARLEAKGYDFKRFKMTNQNDYATNGAR